MSSSNLKGASAKRSGVTTAINVIVTPAGGTAKLSTHELVQWVNDTLHTDTVFKIQDLGSGEYYCLLMNRLFHPREPVQWKKMRFNSKAETDLINNWRAFQAGLKVVGIDKEIPIGRLIAKKPGDNVEFAQWFHKFYMANINSSHLNHPSHGAPAAEAGKAPEYDALEERRKRGIELMPPSDNSIHPKSSTGRGLAKPRSSMASKRSGMVGGSVTQKQVKSSTLNLTSIKDNPLAENGGEEQWLPQTLDQNSSLVSEQNRNLQETVSFLERERDFYFGKLRDIEILCQDQQSSPLVNGEAGCNFLPVSDLLSILYSTQEGFASPTPREPLPEHLRTQTEQGQPATAIFPVETSVIDSDHDYTCSSPSNASSVATSY